MADVANNAHAAPRARDEARGWHSSAAAGDARPMDGGPTARGGGACIAMAPRDSGTRGRAGGGGAGGRLMGRGRLRLGRGRGGGSGTGPAACPAGTGGHASAADADEAAGRRPVGTGREAVSHAKGRPAGPPTGGEGGGGGARPRRRMDGRTGGRTDAVWHGGHGRGASAACHGTPWPWQPGGVAAAACVMARRGNGSPGGAAGGVASSKLGLRPGWTRPLSNGAGGLGRVQPALPGWAGAGTGHDDSGGGGLVRRRW